jgi:hypothetical protein
MLHAHLDLTLYRQICIVSRCQLLREVCLARNLESINTLIQRAADMHAPCVNDLKSLRGSLWCSAGIHDGSADRSPKYV